VSGARAARVLAQAKVNLFLRVLAREDSGYHQIETLFCRLELADVVTVRVGGSARTLSCDGPAMPPGGLGPSERNLAHRAAAAYAAVAGWPDGFEIAVEKHIPVGGGLGGGSADAGAVLRALNALAPRPQPHARLLEIAVELGADVPFLTSESPLALAWGRGERMLALPPLPARDVLLHCFPFGVNTADAYRWLDESRAGRAYAPTPALLGADSLSSWDAVSRLARNDFETAVGLRHLEIAEALVELDSMKESVGATPHAGAPPLLLARMSGSGSTVFLVYDAGVTTIEDWDVPGVRLVRTRTASRVEEVEMIE